MVRFLTSDLFNSGLRPAIKWWASRWKPGRRRCPDQGDQEIAGTLKLEPWLSLIELAAFSQFAPISTPTTQSNWAVASACRELLQQPQFKPLIPGHERGCGLMRFKGLIDEVPVEPVQPVRA